MQNQSGIIGNYGSDQQRKDMKKMIKSEGLENEGFDLYFPSLTYVKIKINKLC